MSEMQAFDGGVSRHDFSPLVARPEDLIDRLSVTPRSDVKTFGRSAVVSSVIKLDMSFAESSIQAEIRNNEFYDILFPEREAPDRTVQTLIESRAWYDRQIKLTEGELLDSLWVVRQDLAGLNRYGVESLDVYMNESAPNFLVHAKAASGHVQSTWRDWMSVATSNEQLLNILEWHNHIVQEQQRDSEIKAEIESRRAAIKQAVVAFSEAGYINTGPDVLDRIDTLQVRIGDSFDTRLQERIGYYNLHNDIVLAQGTGKTSEIRAAAFNQFIAIVLPHEIVHGALNKAFDVLINPLRASWINEPLTEMLSTALREYASWHNAAGEQVEPSSYDPVKPESYLEDIDLINILLAGKHKDSKESNTIAAYRAMTGGYEAAVEFSELIDEAWGQRSVLIKLGHVISSMELDVLAEHKELTAREARVRILPAVMAMLNENPDGLLRDRVEERRTEVTAALRGRRSKGVIS